MGTPGSHKAQQSKYATTFIRKDSHEWTIPKPRKGFKVGGHQFGSQFRSHSGRQIENEITISETGEWADSCGRKF